MNLFGKDLRQTNKPLLIAEISANHLNSIEVVKLLIEKVHQAGWDAVKLQTYTPDCLTIESSHPDFFIQSGLWQGKSMYSLYAEASTPWDWHPDLFRHSEEVGIPLFSSPFSSQAVDFLETLSCPAYKVASFEIRDYGLLKSIAETGKPILISTGAATEGDVIRAMALLDEYRVQDYMFLHCVSAYPADAKHYNLRRLSHLKKLTKSAVGLSDHSIGDLVALGSVALGSSLIEKHVTLDPGKGIDGEFSLPADLLAEFRNRVDDISMSLGDVDCRLPDELSGVDQIRFSRSIYFVKDLKKGDAITEDDIRVIRPGFGAHPMLLDSFYGKRVVTDVSVGTPVTLELVDAV